ncbi:MAG: ABC transporter substrate-binding protein [Ruminiclostridium sp.]
MRKVHEKSIFLGIGIGMIITAIAGMIFSSGTTKELSKAEIMSKAKLYGMIEQVRFGDNIADDNTNAAAESTSANNIVAENSTAKSTTAENTTKETTPTNVVERNISIEIKPGFNSQDLVDALLKKGVITSSEAFNSVLNSSNASTKINIGTFMFKKNEDLNYIVNTICKLK